MRRHFIVLAAALCGGAHLAAQRQPVLPQPPAPTFRSSVEIVHLDVSVLDRDRRPVRGLQPDDFTILEDGTPQSIAVFQAVDIPAPPPPTTPWMREVAPDVRTNSDIQERRLFVLILDDGTVQSPRGVNNVKDIGRKLIDGFGPSDLVAVVFTRDNRNAQDFTTDRGRLLRAVDKYTIGFRDMGLWDADAQQPVAGQDDGYYMFSGNVLESAVKLLTSLPDRRKSIIYVGQGIPVDLDNLGFSSPGLPVGGGASAVATGGLNARFKTQMDRMFLEARRGNINVYTVDACGLRVPGEMGGFKVPVCAPGLEVSFLQTLANNTGARAVVNTNDFTAGLTAILDENASYYLLGYQRRDSRFDGKVRRLEVKVNRPGVEVRTRNSYKADREKDARTRQQAAADSPLRVALAGLLPKSDLPLHMVAAPFAVPGKKEAAVTMVVGIRQPIRRSDARVVEKVDLQVSAFAVEGKHITSKRMVANVAIRPAASGLAEYEVLSRIDLKPGRYQLRVAAHVGSLATSGSLYYDVDVPNFSGGDLSLSGLVLVSPGVEVAPRDALKPVLSVVPTARRDFTPTDTVQGFVRVYQGGSKPVASVPLRVYVLDSQGKPVTDARQTLPAAQFTKDRSANVMLPVPVDRLVSGDYLLVVETDRAKREVRFRVAR
jgi:VWFA-related protein